jgi:RNA polymerase sigma-70 factor (ECF subfamily)
LKPEPAIETQFLELVNGNRQKILRICRVYAWTVADQEDLYQEVLFQIWRALPGLQAKAHANTWLYRVALNTAISFVRKKNVGNRNAVPVAQEEMRELIEQRQPLALERNPQIDKLYEAIGKLDKVERGLVTLFLEDLSYEEMAEVLGLNASHVGVMLHRAKKKLGQFMQEEVRHE